MTYTLSDGSVQEELPLDGGLSDYEKYENYRYPYDEDIDDKQEEKK